MFEKVKFEQVPLVAEDENEHLISRERSKGDLREPKSRRYAKLCLWIVLLETANLLIFAAGSLALSRFKGLGGEVDEYDALMKYNKTWVYTNDNKFAEDTPFADKYWRDMAPKSAIISISEEWAAKHDIPASAPTPDTPGEMVYQMDTFHSLHCLYRIRQRLLTNGPADGHTIHCLNYIRQSLMCHPDLMLGTTNTYEDYGLFGTHVCRDYDAVVNWVEKNRWKGFWDWAIKNSTADLSHPAGPMPIEMELTKAAEPADWE